MVVLPAPRPAISDQAILPASSGGSPHRHQPVLDNFVICPGIRLLLTSRPTAALLRVDKLTLFWQSDVASSSAMRWHAPLSSVGRHPLMLHNVRDKRSVKLSAFSPEVGMFGRNRHISIYSGVLSQQFGHSRHMPSLSFARLSTITSTFCSARAPLPSVLR